MALQTLTHSGDTLPRRRMQPEVSDRTSRILKAAASYSGRQIGHIIDDLVEEHLAKLIDVDALAASHATEETDNAA
jgi:hypothetical protein